MATTVTDTIGTNSRDYSTISAWEAATDNDLVTADEVRVGECYDDSTFSEAVIITGATTDATRFRRLTVASSERHEGTEGTGAVLADPNGGASATLEINEGNLEVFWLEIDGSPGSSGSLGLLIEQNNSGVVGQLLIYETDSSCVQAANNPLTELHCVVGYDPGNHGFVVSQATGGTNVAFYNCVAHGGNRGWLELTSASDTVEYANCAALGNTLDFAYDSDASHPTLQNNASSDDTADDEGGTGHLINLTTADQFVSVTAGSEDFHLKAGADLIDAGTDLGDVQAKIDIDGLDRHSAGVTWDIGAEEEELPVVTILNGLPANDPWEATTGSFSGIATLSGSPASDPWEATLGVLKYIQRLNGQPASDPWEATIGSLNPLVTVLGGSPASDLWTATLGTFNGLGTAVLGGQPASQPWTATVGNLNKTTLDAASALLYLDLARGERPTIGGDPVWSRDSSGWAKDRQGVLRKYIADQLIFQYRDPQGTGRAKGALLQQMARSNKCEHGWDFTTFTSSWWTAGGDGSASFTRPPDTRALADAGLDKVVDDGLVLKLDNSSGSSDAHITAGGGTTGSTSEHTVSAFVRGSGQVAIELDGASGTLQALTSSYRRIEEALTPGSSSDKLRIRVPAGDTVYAILPQLEIGSEATTPIPNNTSGTVTRSVDNFRLDRAVPPVDIALYASFVELAPKDGSAIVHIGDPTNGSLAHLTLYRSSGNYRFIQHNGSSQADVTNGAVASKGTFVELLGVISGGDLHLYRRDNGGSGSKQTSSAVSHPDAYGSEETWLNRYGSTYSAASYVAVKGLRANDMIISSDSDLLLDTAQEYYLDGRGVYIPRGLT